MKNEGGFPRIAIILIIAGLVFAGLVIGGAVMAVKKVRQNREAMQEFTTVSEGINKEMQAKIGKEDTVEGATEKARQIEEAMGKAASKSTGDDAKSMRAAQRLMGSMQTQLAAYEKSYSSFSSTGGLEPKTLAADGAIEERLVLLKSFETANNDFTEFLKGVDGKFRAELARENFPASKTDEMVRGFRQGGHVDMLLAIRGTDQELCAAMGGYLQLLKTERGKWKLNEAGSVIFQNTGAADEFNRYATQIQEVAERQAELQKKVLEARQQGRGAAVR